MVYCGKPSKACAYCRSKRLKCDQKKPGCGQCRNASHSCPGYRNELDLLFRDETRQVERKYQAARLDRLDSEATSLFESSKTDSEDNPQSIANAAARPRHDHIKTRPRLQSTYVHARAKEWSLYRLILQEPISDWALGFFFTLYTPGSHFEYLALLYNKANSGSLLFKTTHAVALASLSNELQRPELMKPARECYSDCLRSANLALQSQDSAVADETIASTLLLAHFETLTSEDKLGRNSESGTQTASGKSSAIWSRHVEGALTLLAMRPKLKLDSPASSRLFQHVSAMIRVSCVQRHVRLPESLKSMRRDVESQFEQENPNLPSRRFAMIVEAFTDLRASIAEGSLNDPTKIILRAKSIDEQTAAVAKDLPPSWLYDVVTSPREIEGVYKNKYHLYSSHHVAQLWNTIRMTRIMLKCMVYQNCRRDPLNLHSERQKGLVVAIERLATEICQSSTQFLQCPKFVANVAGHTEQTSPIASAYFLIWPLFSAAATPVVSKSIIEFVIDRFRYIEKSMKIPQAGRAARMLEHRAVDEDWMHMLHLF